MAKPNDFEKALLDAAKAAQKFHIEMTEGAYLWYSHESFLQNFIAMNMFKNKKMGHCVYVDPSPKKIREWLDSPGKKGPKNLRQRFDLVFWRKSKIEVKAIVEIKMNSGKELVKKDINKVSNYLKTKDGQNIQGGYVLYYTDKLRKDKWKGQDSKFIQDRFCKIKKEKKVELRATYIHDSKDTDPWGFALFRCYG